MCLILFAWQAHPDYPLVVAANRDEWRERPAAPATWWDDAPDILAGRDLEAGGTWLGVTRSGRFAAITNFRDPADRRSTAPSRGQLVADFLRGDDSPRNYLEALSPKAARYNGFNLLLADEKSMCYFGSREGEIIDVPPGIHGLSNHLLDEPWPKVEKAKSALGAILGALTGVHRRGAPREAWGSTQRDPAKNASDGKASGETAENSKSPVDGDFEALLAGNALQERSFAFLSDRALHADSVLPDTGVGLEWERVLSPALIVTEKYGTRCSTVVLRAKNEIVFEERTRGVDGEVTTVGAFRFDLAP